MVCALTLGALSAPGSLLALSRLAYYTITGVCLYFVAGGLVTTRRHLWVLVRVMILVTIVIAGFGIVEFVLGRNILFASVFNASNPLYSQFSAEYRTRITSTLGHPVFLATYLVLATPFLLYGIEWASGVWKVFYGLALGISFSALFLTFSRGGWAGFLGALVVFLYARSKRSVLVGLAFLGLATAVFLSMPDIRTITFQRNTYEVYRGELGSGGRVHAGQVVMDVLNNFPLWGVGTANYRIVGPRYGDIDETPDNAYLIALADGGLLGFALMILVFYQILRALGQNSSLSRADIRTGSAADQRLVDVFLAALTGALIDLATCDALYFPVTRIVFWVVAGASVGSIRVILGLENRSRAIP